MKRWLCASLLFLAACGDDEIIRGNNSANNGSNNASNNATNNGSSNNVVGVPCTSNEECVAPANTCQGDVAVQYTGDGLCGSETGICNFFFVTERVDCTVTTQSCENGACVDNVCTNKVCETPADRCDGTVAVFYEQDSRCDVPTGICLNDEARVDCAPQSAECIAGTCVGPCVGITCDSPPAPRCAGDVAIVSENGTCDPTTAACVYEETSTDCAAMAMICQAGVCKTPVDLCLNVTCDMPPGPSCNGNIRSVYANGTCDPADGMCDYSATTTDCSATNMVCIAGACEDVVDLCLNVVCNTPPDAFCNGDVLNNYTTGVCNQVDGSCSYNVATTDCAATGQTCTNGACVNVPPAAGDLTIVELMLDPESVADTAGEWIEVINSSARTLDLNGLILASTGDTDYTFALGAYTPLAPGDRVVLGINGDSGTNGGVTVNHTYSGVVLDAVDSVTLRAGAVVIDAVSWDATYPLVAGKSLSFGGTPGVDSNDDPANWCSATSALGTDFGTPGAVNDTCI